MILARANLRYLQRHPLLMMLSVIGVGLGVAVVVAVDMASGSARQAFLLSVETLSGRATHEIVGGPQGLNEAVYRRLRIVEHVRASAPVVSGYAVASDFPGRTFQLLGIDPFAEGAFRPRVVGQQDPRVFTRLLTEPATVLMAHDTARALGLALNDHLKLRVIGRTQTVTIVGWLAGGDAVTRQSLASVLLTDIATAQELLGMQGRLSRIDLVVLASDTMLLGRIRAALPAGADIVPAQQRSRTLDQMTRAFRVNLAALSLLALVVGMFLIYNIMTFSVIQRRALVGTLRALGVTRVQVFVYVLLEAATVGAIGTILGIALGVALAQGLVQQVVQTINDLYFVTSVQHLAITPWSLAKGVVLGVVGSVVTALSPAWEATHAQVATVLQRSAAERAMHRRAPRAALTGLLAMVLGTVVLLITHRSLALSYAGLFAIILGYALAVPLCTVVFMRSCGRVLQRRGGITVRLAARAVAATLSRTGVAIAALSVAVSATIGVGVMIDSFRHSFQQWLMTRLSADVYVSAPVIETSPSAAVLDPRLVARLASAAGVAQVSTGRWVRLDSAEGVTRLFVLDTSRRHFQSYRLKRGDAAQVWQALQEEDAVMVSEPYAYRHRLKVGDVIKLRTDDGERSFAVVGIDYDYGSDQGRVTISRRTYDRYWRDRMITSVALYVQPGTDIAQLMSRLRAVVGDEHVVIRSNRALRQASLRVFDRTFAITAVLRTLATIVAVIGVLSALMALQLERARELAVLRATGLTQQQVWQLVTAETGLMGFTAGLLALPLGIGLALALILVINQRSFGWSLGVTVDPWILLQGLGLAVAAALLAGLYPAFRMASRTPAAALREE